MKLEIEQWIGEWWNLFPSDKEVPTDGYLRERAEYCVKKMQKLCKDNKNYTKETIFAATKMYLTEYKLKGYAYLKRPQYFISKLGQGSLLATYCDKIIDGEQIYEQKEYDSSNDFL